MKEASTSHVTLLGEDSRILVSSGIYPTLTLPFVGFALCPFTVVNHSRDFPNRLSPLSAPGQKQAWGCFWGPPDTTAYRQRIFMIIWSCYSYLTPSRCPSTTYKKKHKLLPAPMCWVQLIFPFKYKHPMISNQLMVFITAKFTVFIRLYILSCSHPIQLKAFLTP